MFRFSLRFRVRSFEFFPRENKVPSRKILSWAIFRGGEIGMFEHQIWQDWKSRGILAVVLALTIISPSVYAQGMMAPAGQSPRLVHVAPLGGKVGSSFEVTATGTDLDTAESLHFNFPGVKVEKLEAAKTELKNPTMKKGGGMTTKGGALSQKFKVTLPANAPLGIQDVRVITKLGITNPRAFVISDLPEATEQESNDDVNKAQALSLNSAVSGSIATPTDVDYYQFTGKQGQKVVVHCQSTSLDSKLPAALQIYGPKDAYLGFNRNYQGDDALVEVTLPQDGDYLVRVYSFSYAAGGSDYFYRLTVSTKPWIDAAIPSMVPPGKSTPVTLLGRNLPGGRIDPNQVVDGRPLEKLEVVVKAPDDATNLQRLTYAGFVSPAAGSQST